MGDTNERRATGRRSVVRTLAQVVGIVGVIVCLLSIGGLWILRGAAAGSVDEGVARAVSQLDPAISSAAEAHERLLLRADEMRTVAADARALAQDPQPVPQLLEALAARLTGAAERYDDLRTDYLATRDRVLIVLDLVDWIDGLLPTVELPDGPRELVDDIDARLTALDEAIATIAQRGSAAIELSGAGSQIADEADRIADGLVQAAGIAGSAQTGLVSLREGVVRTGADVTRLVTDVLVVATVVLIYLALVHLALWAFARRGAARPDASTLRVPASVDPAAG